MALQLVAVASLLAGPMDYLRPYDKFAGDQKALLEQLERDKAAKSGSPLVPPADEAQDELLQEESAAPEATSGVQQSKPNVGGAGGLRLGPIKLALGRLPTSLTVVAMAGVGAHRLLSSRTSQALDDELDAECKALSDLTLTKRVEPPAGCSKRQALEELRARKQLLTEHVVPMLKTLEQPLDGQKLGARSSEELAELNTTLAQRVASCASLLSQYDLLGQPPPPGFRSWPLEDLDARLTKMTTHSAELKKIVTLLSKLGGKRMDWNLPEQSGEELKATIATLEAQVKEASERRRTSELLGQVEAELWKRNEEAPVALATLSIAQLEELLKRLKTGGSLGGTKEDADAAAAKFGLKDK